MQCRKRSLDPIYFPRSFYAKDMKVGELYICPGELSDAAKIVHTGRLYTFRVLSTSKSILSSARTTQYEDGPLVYNSLTGRTKFTNPNAQAVRVIT